MRAGEVESETGTEQKITATQVRAWARWPSRSSEDVLLTGTHDNMINTNCFFLHFSILTHGTGNRRASICHGKEQTKHAQKLFPFFFSLGS